MIRGREVGIVEALDEDSPVLGLVGVALVMTVSDGMDVKVLVAVGLIVCGGVSVLLLVGAPVLEGVARRGVSDVVPDALRVFEAVFDGALDSL